MNVSYEFLIGCWIAFMGVATTFFSYNSIKLSWQSFLNAIFASDSVALDPALLQQVELLLGRKIDYPIMVVQNGLGKMGHAMGSLSTESKQVIYFDADCIQTLQPTAARHDSLLANGVTVFADANKRFCTPYYLQTIEELAFFVGHEERHCAYQDNITRKNTALWITPTPFFVCALLIFLQLPLIAAGLAGYACYYYLHKIYFKNMFHEQEFRADRESTSNPALKQAGIDYLQRLVQLNPDTSASYTHPAHVSRIQRLKA